MASPPNEVFISYSRADDAFVRTLLREFDRQGVPDRSDREIAAGSSWIDEIESALNRVSVFLLVISPHSQASEYGQFEAGMAAGRAKESQARIVPILLPGASLPPVLRSYQALRAESMTIEDIAAEIKAIVTTTERKADRVSTELRLFVSSPADVTAEREVVARVVEELNATVGAAEGVTFRRYAWESLPAVELAHPQQALDDMLRRLDVFVLILASRLGTPIGVGGGSGTEEQYKLVVEKWRQTGKPKIFCYLRTAAVRLESVDALEQLRRVFEFRDQLKRDGLVFEFESIADFERAVRLHLTNVIHSSHGRLTSG